MKIFTLDKQQVDVSILNEAATKQTLTDLNGKKEVALRKKWTSSTYVLSNGQVLVEFYDKQSVLLNNQQDLEKLDRIRFTKNNIWCLKRNVSYKIELTREEGNAIVAIESPKRLENLQPDSPDYYDFEVYELATGQILFVDKARNHDNTAIYENLKSLSSDNSSVQSRIYGWEGDEYMMKRVASGDALLDYEPNEHLLYPHYIPQVIENHRLTLIETNIYVADFYSNLYKSANGYYMLIDEINQPNGAGDKMSVLQVRIYEDLSQLRNAQAVYEKFKDTSPHSEHFYQQLSDRYGENFPSEVSMLIDSLPSWLNLDKQELSIDSAGMDLIDEAFKWNSSTPGLFDKLFPSLLAYYGHCYISEKKDGKWSMYYDPEGRVWIPQVLLGDGSPAWDWLNFYKSLFEWPIPLRWAGDWDGLMRKMRAGKDN